MLESVKQMNKLKPTEVKFHHLEIVKDTAMAKEYSKKPFALFTLEQYFELLSKSLQILDPEIIVQRLFSHSPKDFLIAPHWENPNSHNQVFLNYLTEKNIQQGSHFKR
jgi:radical SAM superfamily enzyme